jgi:hypothetical protein
MHIIWENQIGRNIEAYIDDIVVKSKKCGGLLDDLKETLDNLCKYKMMLNPKKCVWCVIRKTAQLHGIVQVEAIKNLHPPRTRKEIQKLAGMMVALNRFISKLGEHGIPFYKLFCKADGFQWDDQAAAAFPQLKQYLKTLSTLVPP